MKQKLIIEVEITSKKENEVFQSGTFKSEGFYFNTDEKGMQNLVYQPDGEDTYPMGLFMAPSMIAHTTFSDESDFKKNETEKLPATIQGISEAALLKALAIVQDSKLAVDLLKE